MNNKVIVVGAGAAGTMAAGAAAENGSEVFLLERNDKIGRKVMITGKGRCNVTNNCDRETFMANTPHGSRFMFSAFSAFSCDDTMSFFESRGSGINLLLKSA